MAVNIPIDTFSTPKQPTPQPYREVGNTVEKQLPTKLEPAAAHVAELEPEVKVSQFNDEASTEYDRQTQSKSNVEFQSQNISQSLPTAANLAGVVSDSVPGSMPAPTMERTLLRRLPSTTSTPRKGEAGKTPNPRCPTSTRKQILLIFTLVMHKYAC